MDNMLYIVAGLVIVLLIAVLIMRRQKAQPPARSMNEANRSKSQHSSTHHETTVVGATNGTKFDSLTIAERFIDQQRYDKAVEALERGLIQKPHDMLLSLKLLNIYALTKQTDAFYRTYDTISAHGDATTIAQAHQLKGLLDQERSQTTQILARTDKNNGSNSIASNAEGYDALDFDVDTLQNEGQNQAQNPPHQEAHSHSQQASTSAEPSFVDLDLSPVTSSDNLDDTNNDTFHNSTLKNYSFNTFNQVNTNRSNGNTLSSDSRPVENSFDLTLDDLEKDIVENEGKDLDLFATNNVDNDNIDNSVITKSTFANTSFDSATDEDIPADNDYLSLADQQSHDSLALDETTLTFKPDNSFRETDNIEDIKNIESVKNIESIESIESIDEDFSLDFDEPMAITPSIDNSVSTLNSVDNLASLTSDISSDKDFTEDFVLDFDDLESSDTDLHSDSPFSNHASTVIETSVSDTDLDFTLSLEDDEQTQTPENNSTSALLFDDDTSFDDTFSLVEDDSLEASFATKDNFDITDNSATSAMPVLIDHEAADTDFATQFAADFDFVNDLDNAQVTLDLATKYLELGEYDSATRLLSEVMIQGNSEQQILAQSLLARTA